MSVVLLDTHAWAWLLTGSAKLSARALGRVKSARDVLVSPISFFEIAQKVRLGKWPEMVPHALQLPALLTQQGGRVAVLSEDTCMRAALLDWPHRDPFDRIIAATAIASKLTLISADPVFDTLEPLTGWHDRVW